MRTVWIVLVVCALALASVAYKDKVCEDNGGTVVVVTQQGGKGNLKHTECAP